MVESKQVKKQLIDKMFENMLNINIYDTETAKDGKFVHYKYRNCLTINNVIKKCTALCSQDYPQDIIRDEAYCSCYEVMRKLASEYTIKELETILADINKGNEYITCMFLSRTYYLATYAVKANLSGYRKTKGGKLKYYDTIEYTEDNLNCNTIDDIFNDSNIKNGFLKWFEQNKNSILTKKQLEFLNDPTEATSKGNASHYRRRIKEASLNAYHNEFNGSDNDRVNAILSDIKLLTQLVNSKSFITDFKANQDNDLIIDILSDMPLKIVQAFNKGHYTLEVLETYKKYLENKLNQLKNDVLDVLL